MPNVASFWTNSWHSSESRHITPAFPAAPDQDQPCPPGNLCPFTRFTGSPSQDAPSGQALGCLLRINIHQQVMDMSVFETGS